MSGARSFADDPLRGEENAMTVCRVLLVAALVSVALQQANAQFGGMPGMPGSPGFGAPAPAPPPQCQQLLKLRDEVSKHGMAIEGANKRKASVQVACRLFKNFLSAELKMIRAVERDGASCGVPANVPQQMKANHAQAAKIGKQVCEAAEQASRPAGPSLSDALGTAPPLPDANNKRGAGTFDTLTGNPLAR
jgi:hypothetical protein